MLEVTIAACSVILIAVSQLLFKSAASGPRRRAAYRYLLDPKIILGLGLNGIAAACWVVALRRLEISYLYPILSVNYLLVPLGARYCFGESLRPRRLVAISVICLGVFICLLGGGVQPG